MTDSTTPKTFVERALGVFEELIREDAGLARELAQSQVEFFRGRRPLEDSDGRFRHLEWFLFERYSETLGGVAGERLLDAFRERADPALASYAEVLPASLAGVFTVTGVQQESGVWLRDMASGGEYPLVEPEAAGELAEGDLIIGRLYPLGDGSFRASPSAGCFRNRGMLDALRADLETARGIRRGTPRVSQATLEATFFSAPESRTTESTDESMARAAAWLAENGVDENRCEEIFRELRAAPLVPTRVPIPGAGDALGRVLAELAFDFDLDLEEARRLLLEAWSSMWSGEPVSVESAPVEHPPRTEVSRALAEFDRARSAGGDLQALFDKLERDLGMDGTDTDEGADTVPDFPGVVGAMVEEFLWDLGRTTDPGRLEELELVRKLVAFGEPIGVFEELDAQHLLAFASCWLLEHGDLGGADEARSVLRVLGDFCRWAEENHGLDLWSSFGKTLSALQESVPRLVEANRHVERVERGERTKVFEVVEVDTERAVVRGEGVTREIELPGAAAQRLRSGDWLRVAVGAGEPRVVGFYPPESSPVLASAT